MSRASTLAKAIGADGTLNVSDVAGLAAVASSGSASDLSTGTLPIARIADGAVTAAKLASGAAVSNIGYTPVNKAGDTMSGPLGVGVFTIGSNSGEARLGRANDRSVGVATIQLGGASGQHFEIVDKGWSKVLFSVTDAGVATLNGDATASGRLTAAGFSNTLGAASRRQVWATGGISLTSGQSMDIIRNRGGYSRAIVEVYGQTGHGSNGYLYRMFQLSRYGLDSLYTSDASSYTTFTLNGSSSTNDNALRINTSGSTVNYVLFVIVHYFGSETGIEFDSPAGLTKIWG